MLSTGTGLKNKSALDVWMRRGIIFLAMASVLAFQAWTFRTSNTEWPKSHGHEEDYYNLLSRGFLSGHLSLKKNPAPALLNLSDPYDPKLRAGIPVLHDVSYYKGKYYLYWGPAPALTLFLPFRYLTHLDLPQGYGNLIFDAIGYIALALIWLAICRDYFSGCTTMTVVFGVLVLGVCGMTLSLLRRPSLWEIPIAAGHGFAMAGLLCLFLGSRGRRRELFWVLTSLFLGLAIASRATYAIGVAPVLLLAAAFRARSFWRDGQKPWACAGWWRELFSLGLPATLIVVGLLIYNFERFDHFFEFGLKYQLSAANEISATHFSFRYAPFNAFVYYLAPAQWSSYFPFVQLIHSGNPPLGYYGIEYTYGLLVNEPVTLLAFCVPLAFYERSREQKESLSFVIAFISIFFAGVGIVLLCFWAATQRYMADFAPTLALLGCIGLVSIERRLLQNHIFIARISYGAFILLACFSIFFGAMISFQLHGLFKVFSPQLYARVAHTLDLPIYAWEKLTGHAYGPLEMDIKFPEGEDGKFEPILSTGYEFFSDQVFVRYVDKNHIQFGFTHFSRSTQFTAPIEIDYKREHHLRIELGSLFPPIEHPLFDHGAAAERIDLTEHLVIALDHQVVMEGRQVFYDSSPLGLQVGGTTTTKAYGEKFHGQISKLKRGSYTLGRPEFNLYGPVTLRVIFPTTTDKVAEPIVQTGEGGKADTLYVRYIREGVVHFGYDHWGVGGGESGDVQVDLARAQLLKVFMPSLLGPDDPPFGLSNRLVVQLDKHVIWQADAPGYPCKAMQLNVGRNFAGSSACNDNFSGLITLVERAADEGHVPKMSLSGGVVRILFPQGRVGAKEPLVVRGVTGAADVLLVHYIDQSHVSFALDHWGEGMTESPPVPIDYSEFYTLEVSFTGVHANQVGLAIKLDGVDIWQSTQSLYPAKGNVELGQNSVGASTCGPNFHGIITSSSRGETQNR